MRSRSLWLITFGVAAALSTAVAAPRLRQWWSAPPRGYCPICRRHEHRDSVVRFQAAGEEVMQACCVSCALSYERQSSKPVTILSVADFETAQALDPQKAVFIVGSDVSPCTHAKEGLRLEQEALPIHWDRCLPSILAFGTPEAADAFRAQHGGRTRTLQQVRAETTAPKLPPG